jgi:GNAT superfamily N-acetyltransferase
MQIDMQPPLTEVAGVLAAVAPPGQDAPDAAFMEHQLARSPAFRYLLARVDGETAGAGFAGSWFPGEDDTHLPARADVLPGYRGRGVTTALLRAASARARELGFGGLTIEVREDEDGYLAYLEARGYAEVERQKAVALDVATAAPDPFTPSGIEIVPRSDEHARGMYETSLEANADIPGLDSEHEASYEDWHSFELGRPSRDPRLAFVALADGRVVGFASIDLVGQTGYHGLTGVRRDYRRRGIARALKLHQIAAAKRLGLASLVTESEERNVAMRQLNESLGYRPIPGSIVLRGPLLD